MRSTLGVVVEDPDQGSPLAVSAAADAIAGVGGDISDVSHPAPFSRSASMMARKFEVARGVLAACLHKCDPVLAEMAASGGAEVRFPKHRKILPPKQYADPALNPMMSGQTRPLAVSQSSMAGPDGFLVQTSIGVDDFEPHNGDPDGYTERLDRRLGKGIEIHAAGLGRMIHYLTDNAARGEGQPPVSLAYADLVTDNPYRLLLRSADVRDPQEFWSYIQVQTIYNPSPRTV